ncbi:UDP-glucose/GDP-mannose dehydrogenase family protein [Micrococcus flavus]|uniref:UDP-glucose 6-dehydrogenase n=1 Tax=Micrococcus flavus TaxID=384602 RepID=A0A4Y8X404_9MICC|nr:UDP-glucose/GDP-mannose dehydrogenase family protein [Micrococcus flavus]MBB4882980.1 UDPglucose 6-dehydrogenase [Micrococcus flavus]TFI04403.1 UDP-glucose/GDP-mannose dehydrogenase family protein [Micrococcus flavus]GGK41427.1 UDP-glucose 6-dehydrogenase [Micrococcus flavus]
MTEIAASPATPSEQDAASAGSTGDGRPRLSVIGTGYLGATHAACMAELGFEVLGVDVDPAKIARLSRGEVPFHEPGLPELLRTHVASGRLRFTTDVAEAARWADVHFIGVGTPQKVGEAAADLTYVDAAVESLARAIDRDALIVGKSTVPVGTARRLSGRVAEIRAEQGLPGQVELAWNPEFLREGFAVQDTLTPDRLVVGVAGPRAEPLLREVYAAQLAADTPWICTDLETAELVKVAANAFLATKISFINAFSEITETVGGDIRTLADAIGHDTRIGRRFLNAGVGFGGGCLPKDIRALQARVSELGLDRTMRFLAEVDDINLRRRDRVVDLAVQMLSAAHGTEADAPAPRGGKTTGPDRQVLQGKRIAVLGVTFKPDSDDVRDSPALDVANRLFTAGADVRVYDPEGNANAAARFPRLEYVGSADAALEDAELVLLLTEWAEFRALDPEEAGRRVAARLLIDGRNVLDVAAWGEAGWTVVGLGHRFDAASLA